MYGNNGYVKKNNSNTISNIVGFCFIAGIVVVSLMLLNVIKLPFESEGTIAFVSNRSMEMRKGESFQLETSNDSNDTLVYSSSNPSVVSVNEVTGFLTATGYGTATITASLKNNNSIKDECIINVVKPQDGVSVTGVTLNPSSITLQVGSTKQLTYKITPANAKNSKIAWSTSNKNVATIDKYGKVTAKSVGTATIKLRTENNTVGTCTVTVVKKSSTPSTPSTTPSTPSTTPSTPSTTPSTPSTTPSTPSTTPSTPSTTPSTPSTTPSTPSTTPSTPSTTPSGGGTLCDNAIQDGSVDYAEFLELSTQHGGDDYYAIKEAHDCANRTGKPVVVTQGTYNIYKKGEATIPVHTSTNFNNSTIYIHNESLKSSYEGHVYTIDINSTLQTSCSSESQTNCTYKATINGFSNNFASLATPSGRYFVLIVEQNGSKVFGRNKGDNNIVQSKSKEDSYRVENGVLLDSSMYWDYSNSTVKVTRYPIPSDQLIFENANFKTIVGSTCSDCSSLYERGIKIHRSNTLLRNIKHSYVDNSANHNDITEMHNNYTGFFNVSNVADVTLQNCKVYGIYFNPIKNGSATNKSSTTYEISMDSAVNVTLDNVNMYKSSQLTNSNNWGVMASSGCKSVNIKNSSLNRVDAHRGIYHLTIDNSTIGYHGINVVGTGNHTDNKLVLNNVTWKASKQLINLREDYGATWNGTIEINGGTVTNVSGDTAKIINVSGFSSNKSLKFGHPIYNPTKVKINGLNINSSGVSQALIFTATETDFYDYYNAFNSTGKTKFSTDISGVSTVKKFK